MLGAFQKPIKASVLTIVLRQTEKQKRFTGKQISEAIDKDEFVLHYQPIISLTEKKAVGAEAVIR